MPAEVRPTTGSGVLDAVWKTRRLFRRTQLRPLHKPVPLEGGRCTLPTASQLFTGVWDARTRSQGASLWGWDKSYKGTSGVHISHPANPLHTLHPQWARCLQTSFSALPPLSQKRITHRCACQSLQSYDHGSGTSFDFTDATRH